MLDVVLVVVIVAVAAALVGRSFHRTFTARKKGCACSSGCPLARDCTSPESPESQSAPCRAILQTVPVGTGASHPDSAKTAGHGHRAVVSSE